MKAFCSEYIEYVKKGVLVTALIIIVNAVAIMLMSQSNLYLKEAELNEKQFAETYTEGHYYTVGDRFYDDVRDALVNKKDYINILAGFNQLLNSSTQFVYLDERTESVDVKNYNGDDSKRVGYEHGRPLIDNEGKHNYLKGIWLDNDCFELFDLEIEEGELFSEEDYIHSDEHLNIILGSQYAELYSIGDQIEIDCWTYTGTCTVKGILKTGSLVIYNQEPESLDRYMILPMYEAFSGNESEGYMRWMYFQKNNGQIYSKLSSNDLQQIVNEYTSYLGIAGGYFVCGYHDQWQPVFALDIAEITKGYKNIAVMLFAVSVLVMLLYNFVRVIISSRYYAILLINGYSLTQIKMLVIAETMLVYSISTIVGVSLSIAVKELTYPDFVLNLWEGVVLSFIAGVFGMIWGLFIVSKRDISDSLT